VNKVVYIRGFLHLIGYNQGGTAGGRGGLSYSRPVL